MVIRSIAILVLCLWGGIQTTQAQPRSSPATERSHVERFSSPEVRAERSEAEANSRLAANPNDDQTLNARSLARMRLGRYEEAQADLRRAISLKPANAEYQAN